MNLSTDMLIVGAGPVGLYAAYYAGVRGFRTVVCDTLPEIGGQISAMYPEKLIFDVAGFPEIRGRDLVEGLAAQANAFSPQYVLGDQAVELTDTDDGVRVVTASGRTIDANVLLITGGIGAQAHNDRRGLAAPGRRTDGPGDRDLCPHLPQIWRLAHHRDAVAQ